MSDTITDPVTPDPGGAPRPAVPDPPLVTPATEGEAPEQTEEETRRDTEGRRVAQVRARLAAAERERDATRAELEFYRRQAPVDPADDTPEQRAQRERAQIRAEITAELRAETFHQQGAAAYPDWKQRCDDLMAMGADAGFAQLIVEMPGGEGVRVAAALAADPDAVERIANLRSERARAVALGKYAAAIEATPVNGTPAPPVPVTRAPPPVRPVTGRTAPVFNEYSANADQLVDFYMKQTIDRQQRR